ncbi:HNH endonuclease [Halomonas sp.]|uniref:HNH endonuclease n=1 Tax=Halomonas sp. TaxID=1486246 RepID=UPI003A8D08EE
MKLTVDLSTLLEQPKKMGDAVVVEIEKIQLPPLSGQGRKLESLEDVRVVDGLLAHGDSQIVLYIQDHSFNFERAKDSPRDANKFHISECKTIRDMRSSGRFERYVMTNNASGKFYITGGWRNGVYIKLNVCMNCLEKLNYQGYRQKLKVERYEMVREFQAEEFFEKYSSFFGSFPRRQPGAKEGYTDDWQEISRKVRKAADFHCQECNVDLSENPRLLHTHHLNGVKRDNNPGNLKALCVDCHSKAPNHERMYVPRKDRLTVSRLRREQSQVKIGSGWDAIVKFADPAVEGLIAQCRAAGVPAPDECGSDLVNDKGEVVANLELAWWGSNIGVAINEQDIQASRKLGWRVDKVNFTIENIHQLKAVLLSE